MQYNNDFKQQLQAMTDGMDRWCERRRRHRTLLFNTTIVAMATVAVVLILQMPIPDGLYMSDRSYRTTALANINGTMDIDEL